MKDNLPLELFEKHRVALGMTDPAVFDRENMLFDEFLAPVQNAVVFLPKSKALIDMTLALISGKVAEGGTIVLAGANDAGIRSAKDLFEKNIGPVDQKIVGNHSALWVGTNRRLGAGKTWRDFLSFFPLSYEGPGGKTAIEVAKLPGVFSAGEMDEGTKLLLDTIPYRDSTGGHQTKILDIGSGAGVIGTIYKKLASKSDVTMSDSSIIAVRASEETLKKSGFDPDAPQTSARVILSDVFDGVAGAFDVILCNPPFHKGVKTDYDFIERFARDAKKHLNAGGEVFVVANSFLPYQDILARHIGATDIVVDTGKFRVYRSR